MTDPIRREDAREILEDGGFLERSLERLAALPAVTVGVPADVRDYAIDVSEAYDTMMEVERNPAGAWQVIQALAGHLAALEPVTQPAQEHVNEMAKTEHGTGNVLTDADLIARLREIQGQAGLFASAAADRIEALVKDRDQWIEHTKNAVWADSEELKIVNSRAERLEAALKTARAYVENMARTWEHAQQDLAHIDTALKGADHD